MSSDWEELCESLGIDSNAANAMDLLCDLIGDFNDESNESWDYYDPDAAYDEYDEGDESLAW